MSLPHIQFYVGDWRKDLGIQSLSYHHRGIWLELLMLMHCSEQRGRLVLNGKPMSNLNLARLLGLTEQETTDAVKCLLEGGVASRDQNGALINRRMVREEELRRKRREAGSIGGSKTQAKREQTPDIDNDIGLEKVREFSKGEGIPLEDADWFYWKGKGNGWTNGGKPILDWRATLRSWKRAGYLPSQKQIRSASAILPGPPISWGDRKAQKQMIDELQEKKNDLFKLKQREARQFTAEEQSKYDALAKRLEQLKAV